MTNTNSAAPRSSASRFGKLAAAAAALALAGLLGSAAFTGFSSTSNAQPAAADAPKTANAPASGGTITVAVASSFTTLDPYNATDGLSRQVAKSFYEGLFTRDKDFKLVPQLAESYTVSDDGLVYTIKLRPGVKFHDGTDFTSEAVKINIERLLNPENRLTRRNMYEPIKAVEPVDPLTVKIILKRPFSPIIQRLASNTVQMVCPSAIKEGNGNIAFEPCGTGPFLLKEYNPSEKLVVVRNPNYWQKGLPKLDGITWLPVVENATRAAMIRTGEAQFIHTMPVEMIGEMKKEKDVNVIVQPSVIMRYMIMNNLAKPFDNPKVRQAVNYAINKDALCKVAFSGYARPATGVIPSQIEFAKKLGPWPYDPAKARELLKEAGFPNGFETTLWSGYNNTTSQKVIQFLQQQLAQVEIRVTLRTLEAGQRVAMIESVQRPEDAKSKLYYIGWSTSSDTDWALRPIFESKNCPPVLANEGYYSNKKVDALLDEALTVTDEAGREAIYGDIQTTIWDDAPWAWLVFEDNTAACSTKLKDFYPTPDGGYDFYRAYLEN